MKPLVAMLALLPLPLAANETTVLTCRSDGAESFEVSLWSPSDFGTPFHCIGASELAHLYPCAPDGGWAVTDPDRPGELPVIALRSPDAAAAVGGKLFARVTPSEFVASASDGTELPLALEVAGGTFWRIRLHLESGEGLVETRDGKSAVTCQRS